MAGRKLETFPGDAFCLILEDDANMPCLSGYKDEVFGGRAGREGERKQTFFCCETGCKGWMWLAEETKDYSLFLCIQSRVCTELGFSLNDFHSA